MEAAEFFPSWIMKKWSSSGLSSGAADGFIYTQTSWTRPTSIVILDEDEKPDFEDEEEVISRFFTLLLKEFVQQKADQ